MGFLSMVGSQIFSLFKLSQDRFFYSAINSFLQELLLHLNNYKMNFFLMFSDIP